MSIDETLYATISFTTPKGNTISKQTPIITIKDTSAMPMSMGFNIIPDSGYAAGNPVPEIHLNIMNTARFRIDYPDAAFLAALNAGQITGGFNLPSGGSGTGFDTFTALSESYRHVVNDVVEYIFLDSRVRAYDFAGREIQFTLKNNGVVIYTSLSYWNEYQGDFVLRPGSRIQLRMIAGGGAGGNYSQVLIPVPGGYENEPIGNGGDGLSPSAYFYFRPNISYVIGNVDVDGGKGGTGGRYEGGDADVDGVRGAGVAGAGGQIPSFDTTTFQNYFDWWTNGTWVGYKGKDGESSQMPLDQPQRGAVNDQQPSYGYGGDGAYGTGDDRWIYGGAGGAGAHFYADMIYLVSNPKDGMISTRPYVTGGLISADGTFARGTNGGRGLYALTIIDSHGTRSVSL